MHSGKRFISMSSTKERIVKKLETKEGMLQAAAVGILTVLVTTVGLFIYDIRKNKKSTLPLGYRHVDLSKIPPITDRTTKDIVKDRLHPSTVWYILFSI